MFKRIASTGTGFLLGAIGFVASVLGIVTFYIQFDDKMREGRGALLSSVPTVAVGLLAIASLILSGAAIYLWARRGHAKPNIREWHSTQLERLAGKTFVNQVVEIDGKAFDHCKFINARLLFHGLGPTEFLNCDFSGGVLVETDNVAAIGMQRLTSLLPLHPERGRVQVYELDEHGKPVPIGQCAPVLLGVHVFANTDLPSRAGARSPDQLLPSSPHSTGRFNSPI